MGLQIPFSVVIEFKQEWWSCGSREEGQIESLRQVESYPRIGEMQQLESHNKREAAQLHGLLYSVGSDVLNLEGAKAH